MLKLDLARLDRAGALDLEAEIPADDPLWEDSGLVLDGPLYVSLHAQEAGSGEVVVRGRFEGTRLTECRRCLEPVKRPLAQTLTLVYVSEEMLSAQERGGDERPIPPRAREIELAEAVREELLLTLDPYVVCESACKGLCPRCGVNLNHQTCECVAGEPDPRWEALRTLKSE
jgi:uncharacterized protein